MLNAGLVARNGAGRLVTQAAAPTYFNGGTPVSAVGSLSLTLTAPVAFNGGLGYVADGSLSVANNAAVDGAGPGGLALSGGKLAVSYTNPVVGIVAGFPVDSAGRLCCVTPVVELAFSDGFDGGFS